MATSNSAGFDYWFGGRPAATLPKAGGQFDYWIGGRALRVLAAAPLVPVVVTPDVGVLTLTGLAPTALMGNAITVLPGVGALTLTGLAPTMAASTALPAYVTRRRRSRRGVAAWL